MSRQAAELAGRRAEHKAAWLLRLKGWRIVGQRVRTHLGEIDLIARRGQVVAFVEVKARNTAQALDLAIDERRLARVAAAAALLYPRYCSQGECARIDVMLVAPWRLPRHLPNVWHG